MSFCNPVVAEPEPDRGEREPTVHIVGTPIVVIANAIAAPLVDIVGPAAWAALIVLYAIAQFSS